MRLLSLELAGFRGFATKQIFDLAADAIIVVGANGNGKTSLFDAVLWAITGRIPRLGSDDSLLACRFSETGQTRVVLRLGQTDGSSQLTVTRVFDGTGSFDQDLRRSEPLSLSWMVGAGQAQ
jgi:DNA repair exonuclease SbcCD ATPase subunit